MKEIKFRAWDKENKCFIPNGFLKLCGNGTQEYLNPSLERIIPDKSKSYKVQLYTGRKDKSGKEIYEGDIMTSPSIKDKFLPCIVKFGEHTDIAEAGCTTHNNIGFYIEDATGQQTGLLNEELLSDWDSFEVIGNIDETPELLAKGKV